MSSGPVGVPAPETPRPEKAAASTSDPSAPTTASESPAGTATKDPTPSPTTSPTTDPTGSAPSSPTESPTSTPSESPTESPTETPTETPVAAPPASVALTGTAHRAAPDEQVPLAGTVSATDGTPVAGQQVTLLQRQGSTWVPVVTATSDDAGSVSLAAPALSRTTVFRLAVGDSLTSQTWRIALAPALTVVDQPVTGSTGILVTARGGRVGDRVTLLRKRPGADVLVGRSRLSGDLTATFQVASPRNPVTYLAQLPRTRSHTAARQALRVLPLTPAAISASTPTDTVGPRDAVTVSGTVSNVDGVVLPGRRVWLLLRARGDDWRRVGSAVSDSTGSVAIAVGPVDRTVAVRLRVGKVRSPVLALRLQPTWSAQVSPGAAGEAVISGTVAGATTGDRVLLRRLVGGRLTTVQQATVGAAGAVRFVVAPPQARKDRYRLVLDRTPMHLRAITAVVVPAP